ncbi:uncharacterized protein GGS22DRAFT_21874 [Annulohypoxylon maeteangense]|uniref:uncharacterized protein n=1 Tax=Annulohypoxylon maeteangense TaxID=1927788 RepID=UPI0020082A5C|nr:uncharacterized protein GGS22DRAFT_21874 [Annulohypoxylon maeteangense]KAI0884322.1 hypothetical protein GGS22DRAFT_21874 [Annulohypoxylon maeteangense]
MGIGLEIPVFGAIAALKAVGLGASRIELNAKDSYSDGGLTPSLEDLKRVAQLPVPVRIMIRPRGPLAEKETRDFVYSDEEYAQMEVDIRAFKESGLLNEGRGDGFVFGILKEDSRLNDQCWVDEVKCWVDKDRCARLVESARPFKVVFHRAFDEIVSCDEDEIDIDVRYAWETGLNHLATCGFDAILTSGGLGHAANNITMLDKIIAKAETLGIEIIVGGGVRRHNVRELSRQLRLNERSQSTFVHSACLSNAESEDIDTDEVANILSQLK